MIYQSNHQAPTMSSTRKASPRPQHRNLQNPVVKCGNARGKRGNERSTSGERCRGRCRVQWSERHVKEGLVLVQEAQLARVVKTGPITEHYEIDPKPFASGQWARVYRCRSRSTGILYAAKYSSRTRFNADCSAELRHEIALLSLCSQSPRVVRLHDVYETPKEIILVMEYAPGGDLQTLIDGDLVPLEGDVVHFVRQLAEGLAYLHERNIAHLDIKPQNLVMMGSFPECDVKLCDFEISRVVLEGTEIREILGTPDYVAPEILHYEPITLAADMWSLGVTTYVLLTGFSPFGGETDQETFQNISLGEVDFPEELFEDVSAQAKDFVAKLLVLDPSARMTAKQCLRHEWLRAAPTQASPHLRKYLSKSREALLERVVSRESLRRAALLSQTTSQANLSMEAQEQNHQRNQGLQDRLLSQSEMCLSHCLSRSSLNGSEGFNSPANSQGSLDSSRTSLNCSSQSCLLNKEQTQGLLSKAQSRSQANLHHGHKGLLSRIRSLYRIQSQACLLNGSPRSTVLPPMNMDVFSVNEIISRSREKLYGLKSLSKSQGVLDIYRSLECLKRKNYQYAKAEAVLPVLQKLNTDNFASTNCIKPDDENVNNNDHVSNIKSRTLGIEKFDATLALIKVKDGETLNNLTNVEYKSKIIEDTDTNIKVDNKMNEISKIAVSESEENLDSLKSIESDTLTEDSDEVIINKNAKNQGNVVSAKRPCERQHSDVSSRSNNSGTSDDKEDRSTESETDEPKYTVAQLVSAFNKHQEVASKTSLEAIMTEKRINEVTFPTGPKALRLFIPDINITENRIVRRKTSYKPRKNWEELRKRNEKNEGVLKNILNDSGNEDEDDTNESQLKTADVLAFDKNYEKTEKASVVDNNHSSLRLTNDRQQNQEDSYLKTSVISTRNDDLTLPIGAIEGKEQIDTSVKESHTFFDNTIGSEKDEHFMINTNEEKGQCDPSIKKRSSSENNIVNEDSVFSINTINSRTTLNTTIDEKYKKCVKSAIDNKPESAMDKPQKSSLTTDKGIKSPIHHKERLPNYIYPDVSPPNRGYNRDSPKDIQTPVKGTKTGQKRSKADRVKTTTNTGSAVNLKDILQRVDSFQSTPKENLENLRKRTSITKIILNDNLPHENTEPITTDTNSMKSSSRAKSEPPSNFSVGEDKTKSVVPPAFVRSASLSSDCSCPTPTSAQSDIVVSWENMQGITGPTTPLEKEGSCSRIHKKSQVHRTASEGRKQNVEEKKLWGRVCTGSYTRAIERFNGRNGDAHRKSTISNTSQRAEKIRRKSSPAMSQYVSS